MSAANKPHWPSFVDVVVVGAGFAGLQAALSLQEAGLRSVVLEAYPRVGGKSYTRSLDSKPGLAELGCTWLNDSTQPRIWNLCQKYGIKTKVQYVEGDEVFQDGQGKLHYNKHGELSQSLDSKDVASYQRLAELLNGESRKVNPATPGCPKPGAKLSFADTSVQQWLDEQGATDVAKHMVRFVCSGLSGQPADKIGLYFFVELIASCFDLETIGSDRKGGGQYLKTITGTSSICEAMARSLKLGTVWLDCPVTSVHQRGQICLVSAGTKSITCSKVIITVPGNCMHKISFTPPLPARKRDYFAACQNSRYAKILLVYNSAWWKELGLLGKFSSMDGPVNFTWEISGGEPNHQYLAVFCVADKADEWRKLDPMTRQKVILDNLAEFVSPDQHHLVYNVQEYLEQEWGTPEYIGGATYPALGAGSYNTTLRSVLDKAGHIHFAGTETASTWRGYMEGALESGERAAAEVQHGLGELAGDAAVSRGRLSHAKL